MDWTDEEVEEMWRTCPEFAPPPVVVKKIATRAVELAAARGGAMTANTLAECMRIVGIPGAKRWGDATVRDLLEHISALGARNAVLEAEREDYRNKMELAQEGEAERDRAMHEAQDEVEKLRERLSAAEDGNRELVRRAQQAEGEARYWQKEHAVMVIQAKDAREEARSLRDRCATLSAAGQVLSAHVDKTDGVGTGCFACDTGFRPPEHHGSASLVLENVRVTDRGSVVLNERGMWWPCSPTCTHDDAATPGHPERVRERSEAFMGTSAESLAAGYVRTKEVREGPTVESVEMARVEGFNEGAEAMRAACWEAVQRELEKAGLTGHRKAFKAAIEGATP